MVKWVVRQHGAPPRRHRAPPEVRNLEGAIRVDSRDAKPPYVRADLASPDLDLADLRGFYGGDPDAGHAPPRRPDSADDRRLIPDFHIPMRRLTGFDGDVALDAPRVKPPADGASSGSPSRFR
jgi:hypothetical protein